MGTTRRGLLPWGFPTRCFPLIISGPELFWSLIIIYISTKPSILEIIFLSAEKQPMKIKILINFIQELMISHISLSFYFLKYKYQIKGTKTGYRGTLSSIHATAKVKTLRMRKSLKVFVKPISECRHFFFSLKQWRFL